MNNTKTNENVQATSTQNEVATNENVQATSTQNEVAKIYTIKVIDKKQVQVIFNGLTYDGKLLNTNPSTHLKYDNNDIILPSKITIDGVQVSTKISGQANFIDWLNTLKGKTFTFNKSTRATSTKKQQNEQQQVLNFIQQNEKLKTTFNKLKQAIEKAQKNYNNFIQAQQKTLQQQNATQQLKNIVDSGILTNEQITKLLVGKNE